MKKILCVIDPTTRVQNALSRAQWLASATGAHLHLIICDFNDYLSGERFSDSPGLQASRDDIISQHQRHLEDLAGPIRRSGLEVSTKAIWSKPLHEAIVIEAKACGADIVFKDTHHHSALSRSVFGNTDWSLIRECPAPLWLVKNNEMPVEPVFIAAVDPLHEHDKPAALDDSILKFGSELAADVGGTLHAFHSFDPAIAAAAAAANTYVPTMLRYKVIEDMEREQHSNRFDEILRFHNIPEERAHLVVGRPEQALPDLVDELGASVVIMGSISRSQLKQLFIGATAQHTLEHLPCDLVTIKPDQLVSAASAA